MTKIKVMSVTNTISKIIINIEREDVTPLVNDFELMAASTKDVRAFAHNEDFGDYLRR